MNIILLLVILYSSILTQMPLLVKKQEEMHSMLPISVEKGA